MTFRHGTIIPAPLGEDEETDEVKKVLIWIRRLVYTLRFEALAIGLIPQIFCFSESDRREAILRYAVEWPAECDEFARALSLLTTYPVTREGVDETEGVGLLFLYVAKKSRDRTHLALARDFIEQHEQVLEEMDAIDLFMELAEATRDMTDVVRVQKQLADLADEHDFFFRIRIAAITQDEDELMRLCRRISKHHDPDQARELLRLLERTIVKLPKAKAERLVAILPSERARKRARRVLASFALN